jgi:prolyl oligopeptidase PreP (S9A serine peptidase family)
MRHYKSLYDYPHFKDTFADGYMIFTTTKDDRVGPVHARKFAARLQEFQKQEASGAW